MAVEVFGVGACLLSAPITELIKSGRVQDSWRQQGIGAPAAYTLDEAIQMVRFMRGELKIPKLFRDLCDLQEDEDWQRLAHCFDTAKLVLVEINSPVGIRYSRYALSRAKLADRILTPLRAVEGEVSQAAIDWYWQGLMAGNLKVLAQTGQILARAVPNDAPNADLQRAVLVDTRPHRRDVVGLVEGLQTIREAFRAPVGIVTYTHSYMPDGRPLPWPADFVEQTMEAAERLGLPVFKPSEFVRSFGPARALMPDRIHYQPEFASSLAESMWGFITDVVEQSSDLTGAAPRDGASGGPPLLAATA